MQILLVEDHYDIAGIVFDYFELKGIVMDHAAIGPQGLDLAVTNHYDLIILDIMLPGMNGLEICRKLREMGKDAPILMLTALGNKEDILAGFEAGADDYLVKPFELEILEARVNALCRRRMGQVSNRELVFGDLTLDLSQRVVSRAGCRTRLNPTQFTILRLLMLRAPDVVSRGELIEALWGDEEPEGNILRSHIFQLRSLVDKPFEHDYISTIRKVGYCLVEKAGNESN